MAGLKLAILLAFLNAGVFGQRFFFDIGTSIRQRVDTGAVTDIVSVNANGDRRTCDDGRGNVYYSDVGDVKRMNGSVALSTPGGATIIGLTCCCDVIAVTYVDAARSEIVLLIQRIGKPIQLKFDIGGSNTAAGFFTALKCDIRNGILLVVSRNGVWIYYLSNLQGPRYHWPFNNMLSNNPVCVACRAIQDGGGATTGYDIFVSSAGANTIISVSPLRADNGTAVTTASYILNLGGFQRVVQCISLSGSDSLHVLAHGSSSVSTNSFDLRLLSASAVQSSSSTGGSSTLTGTASFGALVNGLSVCDSACQGFNCTGVGCNCTTCGFCVNGFENCQCVNSATDGCCYTDTSLQGTCAAQLLQPDACLIINNPLAMRRSGKVVVAGVLRGTGNVTVFRAVRAGRFGKENWPRPLDYTDFTVSLTGSLTGATVNGFNAPLTTRLRGSRFGVFFGYFDPDDVTLKSICIPGVVTENSGFTNKLYTYTADPQDDVQLQAQMTEPLQRFIPSLRWQYTRVEQDGKVVSDATVPTPTCSGSLTCNLTAVTKANDEGVYEVYRPNRKLRNWHPFFYLHVRRCPENMFGPTCASTCPGCVHGHCDSDCGGCVCLPGFMGNTCSTPCSDSNRFGKACDILCTDIFSDAAMCRGLLICKTAKVGCACRSGLNPPKCTDDCPDTYWGPNCANKCACTGSQTCDKRQGCI